MTGRELVFAIPGLGSAAVFTAILYGTGNTPLAYLGLGAVWLVVMIFVDLLPARRIAARTHAARSWMSGVFGFEPQISVEVLGPQDFAERAELPALGLPHINEAGTMFLAGYDTSTFDSSIEETLKYHTDLSAKERRNLRVGAWAAGSGSIRRSSVRIPRPTTPARCRRNSLQVRRAEARRRRQVTWRAVRGRALSLVVVIRGPSGRARRRAGWRPGSRTPPPPRRTGRSPAARGSRAPGAPRR